jgi:hypothetical protein
MQRRVCYATIGYIVSEQEPSAPPYGVGISVWCLFHPTGEKWLNSKFEESLAAYKHEHQKELEQLKISINVQMGRATIPHQRESTALAPLATARVR